MPVRPLGHAAHPLAPGPREPLTADADAVADRLTVAENEVEIRVCGVDDDGAGGFCGWIGDGVTAQAGGEGAVGLEGGVPPRGRGPTEVCMAVPPGGG